MRKLDLKNENTNTDLNNFSLLFLIIFFLKQIRSVQVSQPASQPVNFNLIVIFFFLFFFVVLTFRKKNIK